ncbi:gliding motility-associated C-terminal domain-containing protein [Flavobacteriaceae bacterium M23B6Z8]
MKRFLILVGFLLSNFYGIAQNLVPNASFEEFDVCPPNTSINTLGIPRIKDYIKFWEDNDISALGASSDFFHTCSDRYTSTIGPATGNGHLGGFTYTNNDYREYVQVPLKTALCNGRTYRVKLKLASPRGARRNTDRIGIYFSNGRFTPTNAQAVTLSPQVETPTGQFITNETRWREFTMNFTNTGGGEDHLTIGNFRTNTNTNFVGSASSTSYAYIYIDDVSVEDITPVLTITGGTINDANCGNTDGSITGLSVSGGSGSYTYQWTDSNGSIISTDLNPSGLPEGIYELIVDDGTCGQLVDGTFIVENNCPEPCPTLNLAPNPGFEEIRRCPNQRSLNSNDLGRNVREWYSPNDGTPTLFHQCALGAPFMSGIPSSYPGQGFVGFYTYYYAVEYGDDRKEYVQARLASPMVAGQSYTVQFDIRLRVARNYATDQMGVYFSNNAVTINGSDGELGVNPSLKTPAGTYFTNTDSWQTVTFASPYVANGGEEFVTIGKFENLANTTFLDLVPGQGSAEAFYFIDNVIVEPVSGNSGSVDAGLDQTINAGDSATLTATPTGGSPTYIWTASPSDPSLSGQENLQNPTVSPIQTTTYTVTADFGGGCTSTDQVTITVNATCVQTVDAGPDQTINSGNNTVLTATINSGTPTYTWTASPADPSLSGQENLQNPMVSPIQTTTYTVTADFGGGCTSTDQVTITVNATCAQTVDAGPDQTINAGDSATVTATPSSGTPTYTWTASPADPSLSGQENLQNPTVSPAQTTTYTVTADFGGGCTATDQVTVFVNNSCSILLNDTNVLITNPDCGQANGSITGIIVSGNSGSETYSWTDASGTEVGTTVDLSNVGQGDYTLTVTDGSCSDTAGPFTLTDNGGPVLDASNIMINNADCGQTNGSITGITVSRNSGSETYSWTDASGTEVGTTMDLSNVGQGDYTLTVTDGSCTDTAGPFILAENGGPILDSSNIRLSDPDCGQANGSITGITVSGNSGSEIYSWTDASGTEVGTGIVLTGVGQGSYRLMVTDGSCTTTAGPFILAENAGPVIDTSAITLTSADCGQANGSISGIRILNSSGNETYRWENATGTIVGTSLNLPALVPGAYTLIVEDGFCTATAGPFTIEVVGNCEPSGPSALRIASAMTPNGDGSNDMFMIEGLEAYPNNRLHIYNRWGNKVHEASNYKNDWYGYYRGNPLPVATYYYILELNDPSRQVFKGFITIIR